MEKDGKTVRLISNGVELRYATSGSAGVDIPYNDPDAQYNPITIMPHEHRSLRTGVIAHLDFPYFGMLVGRSSLFAKGLVVHQGTIDCDYEGEIRVLMWNTSDLPHTIGKGDRIAQLIIMRYEIVKGARVSAVRRGSDGFGSSGR